MRCKHGKLKHPIGRRHCRRRRPARRGRTRARRRTTRRKGYLLTRKFKALAKREARTYCRRFPRRRGGKRRCVASMTKAILHGV